MADSSDDFGPIGGGFAIMFYVFAVILVGAGAWLLFLGSPEQMVRAFGLLITGLVMTLWALGCQISAIAVRLKGRASTG